MINNAASIRFSQWLALCCLLLISFSLRAQPPNIVVGIAPVHSLVAAVMDGVAVPELLVEGRASPHGYMLKPSRMRRLHQADAVIWVGASVEPFLPRALASLDKDVVVIELMKDTSMTLLPARAGGMWQAHHDHHHHDDEPEGTDAHLWLDPDNAAQIVRLTAQTLSQLDASNSQRYQSNAQAVLSRLALLDSQLTKEVLAVRSVPYMVFHDAYHYFEDHYGMNAVGSITVDPERKPGARRLMQLRQQLASLKVRCVFSEPQYPESVTAVVTEGQQVKSAHLDPMGAGLTPGPSLYFQLMRGMGQSLSACLND